MATSKPSEDSTLTNNNECDKTSTVSEREKEFDRLVNEVIRRFIRGFSAGLGMHSGYTFIKTILKGSFKKAFLRAWRALWARSSIQTATFLGLFPCLYRLSLHYIKKTRNIEDDWNYLISGAIAGFSILSLDKGNRQTVTFFSLSRALGAAVPSLVARGDLPYIPYTNIAVFSVCTGVIMYTAACRPDRLSPGYYKSIMMWAHDYTDTMASKLFRDPGPRFLTCREAGVHRGSCLKHNLLDMRRAYPTLAKIYLPIYALPILVYKRNALIKSPVSVIMSFIKNMAASTSFLVTMASIAKLCLCILRNAHHQPPPIAGIIPFISGTVGAWVGVLFERKSRQRELALFNIFQVLGIFYMAYKKSWLSSKGIGVPQGFTIVFSVAMMVLMHAYETRPDYLNSFTKAGLKFLVGERGTECKSKMLKNNNVIEKVEH